MVEVPMSPHSISWRKSSLSADGDCIEFARTKEQVWVRDSKNPSGPALGFTHKGWSRFLIGVRRNEFDRSRVLTLRMGA